MDCVRWLGGAARSRPQLIGLVGITDGPTKIHVPSLQIWIGFLFWKYRVAKQKQNWTRTLYVWHVTNSNSNSSTNATPIRRRSSVAYISDRAERAQLHHISSCTCIIPALPQDQIRIPAHRIDRFLLCLSDAATQTVIHLVRAINRCTDQIYI